MTAFSWGNDRISLGFDDDDEDGPVRLVSIAQGGSVVSTGQGQPRQPLVEILTPGFGRTLTSSRYVGTAVGAQLRYVGHQASSDGSADRLEIVQRDQVSGLVCTSVFEAAHGVAAVRTSTSVSLGSGDDPVLLLAVSSFATGAVVSEMLNELEIWQAASAWSAENRWSSSPLRSPGMVAITSTGMGPISRTHHEVTSRGMWSSGTYNPAGAAQSRKTGQTLAWQLEHNGAWHWEIGEYPDWGNSLSEPPPVGSSETEGPPRWRHGNDGAYVALLGPTDPHHQWSVTVDESHGFDTIPVTFAIGSGLDEALGHLTDHRRATRRDHPQNHTLPVVFNDYMNTLNGDPTEDKLRPLVEAAAKVGSEYFCIDAGWYDDTAGWWWSVGDWQASTARFPHGLSAVVHHIRDCGMVPGLWLEPEVVGVTSVAANELPAAAFLQRGGVRLREHDRFLLDLRHPAARDHLDRTVDRLVTDFGIGFFKLDYNVTPGAGTDLDAKSVGAGLLEHGRALRSWLQGILDRHPTLVLENCGSGAMRSDFAMLSVLQLQSTSDQQNPLLYPAIAVGALGHILPEQAANWSYPQADMTDEQIVFTMATGLAGRLYLSGLLHRMSETQLDLVGHGVTVHKETRGRLAVSTPRFPTGLPSWDDPWVSVAFQTAAETYLIVWRQGVADARVDLVLPGLSASSPITQLYPALSVGSSWTATPTKNGITVDSGEVGVAAARMYRIDPSH